MIILLMIAVFILIIENNKLSKENSLLKRELRVLKGEVIPKVEIAKPDVVIEPVKGSPPVKAEEKKEPVVIKAPKHTEKEIKNSSILIVGSFLIVLSAILFLTTTWNITHSLLKTAVLVIMLLVFLLASYLADNVLKIKQTAKAFYYIALAYIPIVLIAIFIFELLGNYLSVNGAGRFIYLFISSIILSVTYYFNAKKKDSALISCASIISMLLSCFFLGRMLTDNYNYICLLLTLFITMLVNLYKDNKIILKDRVHLYCATAFSFLTIIIMIASCLYDYTFGNVIIIDIINEAVILWLIYLLTIVFKKEKIINYIYPLYITFIFFNIGWMLDKLILQQALILISYIGLFIYEIIFKKQINKTTYYSSLVIGNQMVLGNLFSLEKGFLPCYIIEFVLLVLSLAYYIYNEDSRKYSSYIVTTSLLLTPFLFIIDKDYRLLYEGIIALLALASTILLNKENDYYKPLYFISNIFFIISLFNYLDYRSSTILLFLYTAYHFFMAYKNDNKISRVLGYIFTNVTLFSFIETSHMVFYYDYLVIPFTTLIFFGLNYLIPKFKDKTNKITLLVGFIISLCLLFANGHVINMPDFIINIIALAILNIAFIKHQEDNNMSVNLRYLNFASLLTYLFIDNSATMNVISIVFILGLCVLSVLKQKNVYLISAFVYMLFNMVVYDNSKYLMLALFSVITGCAYIIGNGSIKNLYKTVLYICGVTFIEFIIYDFNITDKYYSVALVPVMILIPLISRTIIKPNGKDYKVFEYITYIILNLYALSSATDLEVFIGLLILAVIISYMLKHGPIFLVSLVFVVINVIRLTMDFWLSIPWWIYILVIGSILVFFAMHNEMKEQKEEKLIDKLKKELDL